MNVESSNMNTAFFSRPLKRKRVENQQKRQDRQVHFDEQPPIIFTTYSSDEYDRGGMFSFPVLYKINPSILQNNSSNGDYYNENNSRDTINNNNNNHNNNSAIPPKLSLNTQFQFQSSSSLPLSPTSDDRNSPRTPVEGSPTASPCDSSRSSNSSSSGNGNKRPKLSINTNLMDGPLFLTQLSTTHRGHDHTNDYLVPMSAYTHPSSSFALF